MKRFWSILLTISFLLALLCGCQTAKQPDPTTAVQEKPIREFTPVEPYAEQNLPVLSVDKTVYEMKETITVTCANQDDKDCIYIYPEGDDPGDQDVEPIYTEYIDGRETFTFDAKFLPGAGIYGVYLCDDDGYYIHDMKQILVYSQYDCEDFGVKAAKTVEVDARLGVEITPADGITTTTQYRLYWSKGGVRLADYETVCVVDYKGSEPFTVMLNDGIYMPEEADGIEVFVMKGLSTSLFIPAPEEWKLTDSKLLYRFNVLSDIHVSPAWPRCNALLKKAFVDIIAQGYSSAIFTVGDNLNQGEVKEYDLLLKLVANAGERLPNIYYTMGNHDIVYNNNAGYDNQLALFREKTGMPGAYYSVELNGTRFIILGTDTFSHTGTVGAQQQAWLKEELEKAAGQPVFVFMHQPLKNTVAGTLYTKYENAKEQSWFGMYDDTKALREIFKNYPNAVLFTGHTHYDFLSDQPILLGHGENINTVACASVGKLSTTNDVRVGNSEGLYVEVYEDYILLRGRDFAQGKWCAAMQIKIPIVK